MGTSLKSKVWLGLAFGLVTGSVFRRLSIKYFSLWIPPLVLIGISVLILLVGLILPYIWQSRQKQNKIDGIKLKSRLQHILIYALALDLTMFGFQKIEGLQMIVPLGLLDTPFSSLSGENLLWAFFKYSYPFIMSIAFLQIGSAIALLFSKTRLFGIILALPSLIFISTLDFFYNMPVGVLLHGLVLLLGIFYLLSQDYKRLIQSVFQPLSGITQMNSSQMSKILIRSSLFIWPALFYFIYQHPDRHPGFTGSYTVKNLEIDHVSKRATHLRDSVLTTVYLDLDDEVAFDFNDYRSRYIGNYTFDQKTDSITIHWRYPASTIAPFKGKLLNKDGSLLLSGKMSDETLSMDLIKINRSSK